ncbi:hypothetical protein SteCoe_28077 [Stentor coeruleus]|uniref:PH domain-containing protein n=1 Tax=Stentor coeruleus TaxID=5963 RepID=A0A1R2B919_9CILI|nr:hypothetical protein SteCoe_28077 [Stentor coeruleus]
MDPEKYVDPMYKGPTLIRGYLKKLKSDSALSKFISKFNKRYFIIDLNNYFFGYQDKETSIRFHRHDLCYLINIDPNPRVIEICDWKFAFVVEIQRRVYTLHADSVSAHNEWCNALKACLKPVEKIKQQNEIIRNPISYLQNRDLDIRTPTPIETTNSSDKKDWSTTYQPSNSSDINRDINSPLPQRSPYEDIQQNKYPIYNTYGTYAPDVISSNEVEENKDPRFQVPEENKVPHQGSYEFDVRAPEPPVVQQKYQKNDYNTNSQGVYQKEKPAPEVQNGPILVMLKGDFQEENKNIKKNQIRKPIENYDDDEISLVSGPKSLKKPDDLEPIIPIMQMRPPSAKGIETRIERKSDLTKPQKELEKDPWDISNKPIIKAEPIAFKQSGILDMMAEMNDLGLENVEIRPLSYLKQKSPQETFPKHPKEAFVKPSQETFTNPLEKKQKTETKETFTKAPEQQKAIKTHENYKKRPETFDKSPERFSKPQEPVFQPTGKSKNIEFIEKPLPQVDDDDWDDDTKPVVEKREKIERNEKVEKKGTIGSITVKPIKKKTQIKFVEKPEIVPDDEYVNKKKSEPTRKIQVEAPKTKGKTVFKEKTLERAQGKDCDWDEWDD